MFTQSSVLEILLFRIFRVVLLFSYQCSFRFQNLIFISFIRCADDLFCLRQRDIYYHTLLNLSTTFLIFCFIFRQNSLFVSISYDFRQQSLCYHHPVDLSTTFFNSFVVFCTGTLTSQPFLLCDNEWYNIINSASCQQDFSKIYNILLPFAVSLNFAPSISAALLHIIILPRKISKYSYIVHIFSSI